MSTVFGARGIRAHSAAPMRSWPTGTLALVGGIHRLVFRPASFLMLLVVRALVIAGVLSLLACSTPGSAIPPSRDAPAYSPVGKVVFHSFSFDVRDSEPKVVVMNFRYGDGRIGGTSMPAYLLREGKPVATTGVGGRMVVGRDLYIMWKIVETGEIYEQRVNLIPLLPSDMRDREISLDIKGNQLFVYVVHPDRRAPDKPRNGPSLFRQRVVTTIYEKSANAIH